MSYKRHSMFSKRNLAAFLLTWNTAGAQSPETSGQNVTEVTSVATAEDGTITAIYTPTSLSISGLAPPITAATTITSVNDAGETVAVAVAAGAGVVAGGALAAWLFKPVPGAPPAPTQPPAYTTEPPSEEESPSKTDTPTTLTTSTTTQTSAACPFPTSGNSISFEKPQQQPQWTVEIPPPSAVSSNAPECTKQGDNNQLLRGTDPGYLNALAQVFCDKDLSKDQSATLGQADLADDSNWKNAKLDGVRVKFDFSHKFTNDGCKDNCVDAYKQIATRCQYNSHVFYGGGNVAQGCGDYSLSIDADPITKLSCNSLPDPVFESYMQYDASKDAIKNFCAAKKDTELKQGDESKNVKEDAFSITYAKDCQGSGSYTVTEELCVKYLEQTINDCDKETPMYKHGGTVTDTDNCAAFSFHPTGRDIFACYPDNKNAGYIGGSHASVSREMAQDAISQFCDRKGNGQTYSLDPNNIPSSDDFKQDTCTESGMASCGYYYKDDGTRTDGPEDGSVFIRLSAEFSNPNNVFTCSPNVEYEIQGDRCRQELGKVMGQDPKGKCVGNDPSKLDLGTFIENSEKGCVLWNFWAVSTR